MHRLLALNGRMVVNDELNITCRGIFKFIFPALIWMSEEKITESVSEGSRSQSRFLNRGPVKYKIAILTT
jgi:hypothetical protein